MRFHIAAAVSILAALSQGATASTVVPVVDSPGGLDGLPRTGPAPARLSLNGNPNMTVSIHFTGAVEAGDTFNVTFDGSDKWNDGLYAVFLDGPKATITAVQNFVATVPDGLAPGRSAFYLSKTNFFPQHAKDAVTDLAVLWLD